MAVEQFANNAANTLNGGINASATSLVVTSAAGFPTQGNFRILIDSEIIIVGSVSGSTFSNLTRGAENTTAATHSNAAAVTHIVTAGSMVKNPRSMSVVGDIEYLAAAGPAALAAPADGSYSLKFTSGIPSYIAAGGGGGSAPSGSILMFGGTVAPTGFLMCNGQAVSRATYAALFAVIGVTYGAGDGSTTFNVPNMQQRFPIGKAASGTGSVLGGTGGLIDHTHTVPGLTIPAQANADLAQVGSAASVVGLDSTFGDPVILLKGAPSSYTSGGVSAPSVGVPSHNHGGNTNAGTSGLNNPPFLSVNFIIAQ